MTMIKLLFYGIFITFSSTKKNNENYEKNTCHMFVDLIIFVVLCN